MTRCHCSSAQSTTDERVSTAARADERVEPAEALAGRVDHRRDLALARDVDRHRLDGATGCREVVGDLLRARLVDVGDDDAVAVEREPVDDRLAEPGRATGHDVTADASVAITSPHRRQAAVARDDGTRGVRRRVAREEQRDRARRRRRCRAGRAGPGRASISRKRSGSSICSVTLRKRGVSIEPGAMTLARTVGPYSTAICRVSATSPAFAAPYAA